MVSKHSNTTYVYFLLKSIVCLVSDIDDEGEVEANIKYNYELNDMQAPRHIAHTWGAVWHQSAAPLGLKYIIASDILLYVR